MQLVIIGLLVVLLAVAAYAVVLLRTPKKVEPDQSMLMLSQRLEAMQAQVSSQLEHTRQAINTEMDRTRQSSERTATGVSSQVQAFTRGMTELRETVHAVQESVKGVASFQEMFRSPKLRGQWGELSLGSILKEYFPQGGFQEQYYFKSGEAVDAIVKLPNGLILPIDSKFNWDNFQKMTEADAEPARVAFRKTFLGDVKKKVDEIANKYVLPSEGTTDLALMYVPAEAIYYEIIQHLREDDVAEYARRKKILLASPNTLYITLTAVAHWFKDDQVRKATGAIIKKLETVIKDATTLGNEFRKLGDHLDDARSAYEKTDKRLSLLVERTQKVIELGEEEKSLDTPRGNAEA